MRVVDFLRTHKIVFGVIVFDLLLIIGLLVAVLIKMTKTAIISVNLVPNTAVAEVGGGSYQTGNYRIRPGNYNVKVKADGFITKEFEINPEDNATTKMSVFLVPAEDNLNYYAQNMVNYESMGMMKDEEAQRYYKILSIEQVLPINYNDYNTNTGELNRAVTIMSDNGENCKAIYCLKAILTLTDSKDWVKKIIKEKGFDSEDYEIIYKTF